MRPQAAIDRTPITRTSCLPNIPFTAFILASAFISLAAIVKGIDASLLNLLARCFDLVLPARGAVPIAAVFPRRPRAWLGIVDFHV